MNGAVMDLSFVVPCHNEQDNVKALYDAIRDTFANEEISYEVIMVNDGSKDETASRIRALYEEYPEHLTFVDFSRNFGKEAAILAGMKHTRGDAVCFIDADLQQNPKVALEMYRKLKASPEYDCVAAYQKDRNEGRVLQFFKNAFYKLINRLCEIDFVSGASDFRVCSRRMVDAILSMPEYHRFSKGIFSWVGFETFFMEYHAEERRSGTSSWSFFKLFKYAIDGIVGYTTVPLRIATMLGILLSCISIVYMVVLVIKTLILGIDVPGYATTLGFVLLLGGIQLLMLGIIGEYLAKAYIQGKNRPVYIEKEVLEGKNVGSEG